MPNYMQSTQSPFGPTAGNPNYAGPQPSPYPGVAPWQTAGQPGGAPPQPAPGAQQSPMAGATMQGMENAWGFTQNPTLAPYPQQTPPPQLPQAVGLDQMAGTNAAFPQMQLGLSQFGQPGQVGPPLAPSSAPGTPPNQVPQINTGFQTPQGPGAPSAPSASFGGLPPDMQGAAGQNFTATAAPMVNQLQGQYQQGMGQLGDAGAMAQAQEGLGWGGLMQMLQQLMMRDQLSRTGQATGLTNMLGPMMGA